MCTAARSIKTHEPDVIFRTGLLLEGHLCRSKTAVSLHVPLRRDQIMPNKSKEQSVTGSTCA